MYPPPHAPAMPSDAVRTFTPKEAEALLDEIVPLLEDLQKAHQELHFAAGQGRDLEQMWGDEIHDPACTDHDDYVRYTRQAAEASMRVQGLLCAFHERGVEVKDPATGLLDFHTERDNGEVAYLCWRSGEDGIEAWHTMFGGFAGRRPLDEL